MVTKLDGGRDGGPRGESPSSERGNNDEATTFSRLSRLYSDVERSEHEEEEALEASGGSEGLEDEALADQVEAVEREDEDEGRPQVAPEAAAPPPG